MVTAATPSVIRTGRRDKADVSRFSRSASITKSFFSMGLNLYYYRDEQVILRPAGSF